MSAPSRPHIPAAPAVYSQSAVQQIINAIANELAACIKSNADIRIHGVRLTLVQPNGVEKALGIDNTGALNTDTYP